MVITERYFILNNQWNIVHLPERPNGFGVLIVGDINHFVESNTTSWMQHPERFRLIEQLRNSGYTIFYSNLFERNWGSLKAVYHLTRLYKYIMKKEILNPKIHLLCEGMGALAGLKFAEEMPNTIRSISLINPCIYLYTHIQHEKEKKLFYKRLLRELSEAYETDLKKVEEIYPRISEITFLTRSPTKIWHLTQGAPYSAFEHSRKYEQYRNEIGAPIELSLQLPRNNLNKFQEIYKFFKRNETIL